MIKASLRLQQQIQFILEADRLKNVLRQNVLADRSRQENSAEHSWHLIVMANVLHEHFPKGTDLSRVSKMLAVHDLVEIMAGDVFAYDEKGAEAKAQKEQQAANEIFGKLPPDQRDELIALWHEFEEGQSNESRAAWAVDRLQPFIMNFYTEGASWRKHGVRRAQVEKRMAAVCAISPELNELVMDMIEQAVKNGWIKP
ncbi:MAG TPA: HD domain-containing protein [Bdellovibrionales bacterium]|nr:HD domain-containing protein [Bdellovibrionales bacterium]